VRKRVRTLPALCVAAAGLALVGCPPLPEGAAKLEVAVNGSALTSGGSYDFGACVVGTSSAAADVVVTNTGTEDLSLSGTPAVVKSGANPAEFVVVQPPITVIAPEESATFTVKFAPASVGVKTAFLIVTSNDTTVPSYTIDLAGEGVPVAVSRISLTFDGVEVASGDPAAFGGVTVGQSGVAHTFAVRNTGTAVLTLTGNPLAVAKDPPGDPDFSIAQPAQSTVAAGGNVTFTVTFAPQSMGAQTCTLLVPSDDPDTPIYTVIMNGTGTQTPSAPTGLTATTPLDNQVDLAWTDASTIEDAYVLERGVDAGAFTTYQTLAANATSYSDTGLTLGHTYAYRVMATNTYGASGYSNEVSKAIALAAPTGLAATAAATNAINLSWTDTSTIEQGFRVERSATGTGGWSQIGTALADATSYQDKGGSLTPGSTWFYRVCSYYGAVTSYSGNANATTLPTWSVTPVDSAANDVGQYASLRLTADSPRIAYYDATARRPKYASYGSSWSTSTLDTISCGGYVAMALNGSGYPRVSYYDDSAAPYNLRYAEYNGSTWSYTSLDQDASADTGKYTAIALDASGNPQVGYWAEVPTNAGTRPRVIRYSSGWQTPVNPDTDGVYWNNLGGEWISIATNGNTRYLAYSGKFFISAVSESRYAVRYATSTDGTTWTVEDVEYKASGVASNQYAGTSVAFYGTTIYIVFYDAGSGDLRLAKRSGTWSVTSIATTNDVGRYPSVAVDSTGGLHVSYHDVTSGDLCYTTSTNGGTSWSTVEIVDSAGTVGQHTSIAVGGNDYPRIAYYDASNTNLKFAVKNKPLP
jgi:hypothetical protein